MDGSQLTKIDQYALHIRKVVALRDVITEVDVDFKFIEEFVQEGQSSKGAIRSEQGQRASREGCVSRSHVHLYVDEVDQQKSCQLWVEVPQYPCMRLVLQDHYRCAPTRAVATEFRSWKHTTADPLR